MKKIFLLFVIFTITQSIFGQKENLKFNLNIGETYNLSMKSSSIINQEINGQKTHIALSTYSKIAFKIIGFKDTVYDMKVSYEGMVLTMKLPNGKDTTFSSNKKDQPDILSSFLEGLKGKPFFIKMTNLGKIVELKNMDSIFENIFEQTQNFPPEQIQNFKTLMLQSYGEKAFKTSFEIVTNIYSNAAVEKGNTWNINTKFESGISASLKTTYEFKDKIENYNLIIGNGNLESLDKDIYTKINGFLARYDLTGTMEFKLKTDSKTGWIIHADIKQKMGGNIEMKDIPNLPNGLKVPFTSESQMTYDSK